MVRFIVFRLFYIALVLVVVSMLIFGLSRLVGDPRDYYLDEYATDEQYEAWGRAMGLDKPLAAQYFIWASKAVRGEFGQSLRHRREAFDVVAETVPCHTAAIRSRLPRSPHHRHTTGSAVRGPSEAPTLTMQAGRSPSSAKLFRRSG